MRLCGWSPVYERRSEGVESCFSDCGFRNLIIRNPTTNSWEWEGWEISPLCWNVDVWLLWIFEIVQHWWCLGFMDLLQWDIFYPENSINLSAAQSTQLPWNFYEGQFTEPQPGVAICAPKVIPKRAQGNPRITSRIHKYMRIQHPVDRPTVSNEILKFNLLSL